MDLPENVIEALHQRQKTKAIKLLRKQRGIGLKAAKDIVDQYLSINETKLSTTGNAIQETGTKRNFRGWFIALLVLAAFVWAMINLVAVAGSLIVLWHHDDYRETTFVIGKVHYNDDAEAGLTWGFVGTLLDG